MFTSFSIRHSVGRSFSSAAPGPKRLTYVKNLPWFAQVEKIPTSWKFFGVATLAPLIAGGVFVHTAPLATEGSLDGSDPARRVMGWSVHYASLLVAVQPALHWGMQAANMGLPTSTIEFTPLYRFMRFGLAVVPLSVAVLASRLSVDDPRAACVVLLCMQSVTMGADLFAYAFATCPVWFTRYHWNLSLGLFAGLTMLLLSERMKIKGELNRVNNS